MHRARRPTVMVAESHEDTRSLLKFWLEQKGYRVVEAVNGQEAFELTGRECPDLLLMALRMPTLNGLEATRRIRKRGEDCVFPIVAMSTYLTTHERATALAAGCNGFIAEPIDFDNVNDVLSDLLQGSSSQRSQESY